jgi:hypothetical protein
VISVNWPQQRYRASHSVPNTFHFTVTRTCNGQPADIDFFPASQLVNTKWLDSHGAREFADRLVRLRGCSSTT